LGFWGIDISVEPGWIAFQRAILGTFLFLVGVSLELGHGERIRWRAFWRRLAILLAAALAMTAGTYLLFGDAFAFFGILHAIALFSVIGLVFLRLPVFAVLLAAAGFIAPGVLIHSDAFNPRWLAWLGMWTAPPRTADLVGVFPWAGVTLIGIAATRVLEGQGVLQRLAQWQGRSPPAHVLRGAGRWSLLIYLTHQLLLLAILYPLALWLHPGEESPQQAFVAQCQPSCLATGGVEGYCTAYCGCAFETIDSEDLWDAVNASMPSPEQRGALDRVISLCRAMAE
jgi:uncharacterized membrane protein